MTTRDYYLQTLAKEPFAFDFTKAKSEFALDFPRNPEGKIVRAAWQGRVWSKGVGEFKIALIMTIRTVVLDIFANVKSSFKLVFVYRDLPGLKNFSFTLWNITVADSALVLSLFVGIVAPSTRDFAESLHKGDIYLLLWEKAETPEEAEEKLAKKK